MEISIIAILASLLLPALNAGYSGLWAAFGYGGCADYLHRAPAPQPGANTMGFLDGHAANLRYADHYSRVLSREITWRWDW